MQGLRKPGSFDLITSIVRKTARSKMDPNDIQSTIRTYSNEVDHRLPPGHEAHDLGQALAIQVDSEIPVPSKHSLIRRFFEQDAPDCDK